MNLSDLTTLLDFHYWARDRVLDAAALLEPEPYTRDLHSSFRSVRDTLVHVYAAECAWYQRWQGTTPAGMLDPADYPDVATLRAAWTVHEVKMRAFVAGLGEAGVGRQLEYRSLDGRAHVSAFGEMVQHLVNHGTYHRGQVQTLLRQLGAAPSKSVDLIAFSRERNAANAAGNAS